MVLTISPSLITTQLPPSPSPLVTTLLNNLRWLSPRTHYAMFQLASKSPYSPFDASELQQALLATVLPTVTIFVLFYLVEKQQQQQQTTPSLKQIVLFASPWMLQSVYKILLHGFYFIKHVWITISMSRSAQALPSAIQELESRILSKRAYRTHRYDVYLPKSFSLPGKKNNNEQPQKTAIFFPGAMVPHESYSKLAGYLSDAGLLVVIPSMEPTLLAHPVLGGSLGAIQRIITKTQMQLGLDKIEWSLMGHSMGAFCAMRLYDQFQKLGDGCSDGIKIRDLVMLAVANFIDDCTDLSMYNDTNANRILLIQGTNDPVLNLFPERSDELYAQFPDLTTIREEIQGGTHHGFACYANSGIFVRGTEGITPEQQQQQVAALASQFLLSNPSIVTK